MQEDKRQPELKSEFKHSLSYIAKKKKKKKSNAPSLSRTNIKEENPGFYLKMKTGSCSSSPQCRCGDLSKTGVQLANSDSAQTSPAGSDTRSATSRTAARGSPHTLRTNAVRHEPHGTSGCPETAAAGDLSGEWVCGELLEGCEVPSKRRTREGRDPHARGRGTRPFQAPVALAAEVPVSASAGERSAGSRYVAAACPRRGGAASGDGGAAERRAT